MIEDDDIINDGDKDDDQSKHWYLWVFYFNPGDKRALLPKRYGFGWTMNFANPFSVLILLVIILAIVLTSILHK